MIYVLLILVVLGVLWGCRNYNVCRYPRRGTPVPAAAVLDPPPPPLWSSERGMKGLCFADKHRDREGRVVVCLTPRVDRPDDQVTVVEPTLLRYSRISLSRLLDPCRFESLGRLYVLPNGTRVPDEFRG